MERQGKLGLASAYIDGYKWGLARDYDAFIGMDADFSHDPSYLPTILEGLERYDIVIGSRNVGGGRVEGWAWYRVFLSKGGSLYARTILGCPIRDLTGGYNGWTRKALETIGLDSIISTGYSFLLEMKHRAYRKGVSFKEFPIVFKDRMRGASKMSMAIFFESLTIVWKIRRSR